MEGINGALPEILLSSGLTAGGIGSIIWYFIKRLIARIDKLEDAITGKGGLETQMVLNIANDKNFVIRFEEHLKTHKGIKEDVAEMLDKFKKDLFEDLDKRYKLK